MKNQQRTDLSLAFKKPSPRIYPYGHNIANFADFSRKLAKLAILAAKSDLKKIGKNQI